MCRLSSSNPVEMDLTWNMSVSTTMLWTIKLTCTVHMVRSHPFLSPNVSAAIIAFQLNVPQKLSLALPGKMWFSGTPKSLHSCLFHDQHGYWNSWANDLLSLEIRFQTLLCVTFKVCHIESVLGKTIHSCQQIPRHSQSAWLKACQYCNSSGQSPVSHLEILAERPVT